MPARFLEIGFGFGFIENGLKNVRLKREIFFLWSIFILAVIHCFYYYQILPDEVAVHFNISGEAVEYWEKLSSCFFQLGLVLFNAIIFHALAKLLPRLNDNLINIPRKDYWFSSERRAQTLDFIVFSLLRVGIVTGLFLLVVFQTVVNVNLSGNKTMSAYLWIAVALYLAAVVVISFLTISRFKRKN